MLSRLPMGRAAAFLLVASVFVALSTSASAQTVTLVLTPASVTENGGVSTVTATVTPASSTAFTVTVAATAVLPAVAGDFTLSTNTTLSFAANATASTGTVTITGVDNSVYAPNKSVTVSGTVTGGTNVTAPGNQTLTLSEDETLPTVTLALSPASVTENGGVATVTASLSGASSASTTLTVSATAVSPAVAGDFTLSTNTTLTIAANATASTGTVTITGVDNSVYAPDKSVRVSATVTGGNGVSAPGNQTLTLSEDETLPTVTLVLTPASIDENGGVSTVTATLSGTTSAATTLTVSATAVSPAVSGDFTLSSTTTLTIAALATASSGTVTITGVDNSVYAPDKSVTVSATVTGGNGVSAPGNQTLTLSEDETLPTVTLVLTPGSVTENGGVATVTASLSGATSASTTLTVSAAAVSPAVSGDFTLSSTTTLTIAALATASSGLVTITGVDNSIDAPDKSVRVSATVTVAGGGASLSGATSASTTLTVSAAAVSPAVSGDFTLSSTTTLTIAALATASSGLVTITGVDNSIDAPDKSVRVSATVSGGNGVSAPGNQTLTLSDDEVTPTLTLVLTPASIDENGGISTVTASLSGASSAATTVTVSATAVSPAVSGDFTLSSTTTLTIAALATASSGTVTITGVDNSVDAPDKSVTVSATVTGGNGVSAPGNQTLTLTDDEATPAVTLVLTPGSVTENGGVAAVTASLSGASSASTTVTVSAAAVSPAVSGDFTLSSTTTLTIAALATTSSGTVTITGVDNSVDAPNKSVTVSGTASNTQGATDPADVTLTLTDDEATPAVTLVLTPGSVTENGGVATVTATLSGASSEATTVTVSAAAVSPAVSGDFTLSSTTTLTIAALATTSSGTVTITGVDNSVDAPNKSVTVSGTASNTQGATDPADVTLTLTDDEATPAVTLVLTPASVTENGGVATVTASLSGASSEATTLTVSAAAVSPAVAGDFTLSSTTTLTIAALATTSSGTVTITGVDNSVDAPNKSVTVSGTASNTQGATDPADVTLTLTDDEATPAVTLVLTPASIDENGGVSTVTATLSGTTSAATTVTVSATAVSPAVSGDFTLSSTTTLTIAALATTSSGTVTITGVDNSVYAPDKSVTVSATVTGGNGVSAPGNQTLTLSEDETLPTVTLVLTPGSVTENGGVATVTASLSGATSASTTLTVSATAVSPAVSGDFTLSSTTTLTIAALATASSGLVTITGVDNSIDAPDKSVRVSATVTGGNGVSAPGNQTLTLSDDEVTPTLTLVLTPGSVSENGGISTVTASLSGASSAATTVTVSATAVSPAVSGDFTLSSTTTLTIAALATASSGTVTITGVDNSVDAPDKSVTVSATVSGGNGVSAPGNQTLTLSDDEVTPTVTLVLTPGSVTENGGVATVTASLSGASSASTTLTVSAAAVSPAVLGDFTLSSTTTLTIAALATTSSGTVTITGVDNSVDAPNKSVTVSGTASNTQGATDPADVTLTLTDDEVTPTVTLVLTPASVTENGGVATVTATLSGASSEATTLTVSATAVSPAVSGDFTLSSTTTLTIAALATASSGTVTITGVDNSVYAPDKSVTVSATVTGGNGVSAPGNQTLTLSEDETLPTVTLVLTPASIDENGGVSTVTATLSGASSEATTVTVSAAAVSPAVSGDFTLSSTTTLTIAALATASSGTVTITGVDNSVYAPDKSVRVSATVTGGNGVSAPGNQTLTLSEDETLPTVTLVLTPGSVTENGGVATVTATLSGTTSAATTLTVSATAVSPAVSGDFTLSSTTTLTIAALATASSGLVTITGVDNSIDAPDKSVRVSATVTGGNGVSAPGNQTLTLSDDEVTPTLTLVLTPGSIDENGGISTVTASLSGASSAATTVTVSATAVSPAVSGDFTLSSTTTLTIAALATASSGTVTITGVDNSVDAPDKSVTVSATVTGGNGVSAPGNQTLTLTDDEATPAVTLVLTPGSVTENGGVATVTASLSGASSASTTVTVSAAAVSPAVSGDFTLSSTTTLTIAALATTSSGTVTITGVDNSVDAPNKSVTVSGTASNTQGATDPADVTLTLTDDEVTPTVTLVLTPGSVTENGGVATVTATLSGASSEATTLTVSAAAVSPAVAGDFTLSSTTTLTIAALATTSSGTVTITGVDNSVDAPNKSVTVSGTASNTQGATDPADVTLTLTDDEATPAVTLVLTPASIDENGGVSTVTATLSGTTSAATTVTVSATAVSPAVSGDFTLSSTTTLTIAALATTSSGTVTITGVDNSVYAPDKSVTVSATVTGGNGVSAPGNQTLTLSEDETLPTVTLVLTPGSVTENGGVATVTASLSGATSASTTLTVSATAVSPAVSGDFTLSSTTTLTIAALATASSGLVTITGVDNSIDAPDKSVRVSATVTGGNGVSAPGNQTLTLSDDEVTPTLTLVLTPGSVSENGGISTVTASLSGASSAATTVTVSATAVSPAVSGDFTLSSTTTLTIAALATASSGTVTITGVDNSVDAPDKSVTVSATVSGGNGVSAPGNQTLTLTDDEATPAVTLVLTPGSVTENGGVATVTASLSGASSASTTLTVSAAAVSPAVSGDFTLSSTTTLTIAALATTSSGTVTITGVDNSVDAPNKSVTVSGTASNTQGATDPADVTLTLTDDEVTPTVTLVLTPASVTENGGVATVTATLSGASSEATTVTVSAAAVSPAVSGDFTLSSTTTLTIAALATTSSGTVTITGVDNSVYAPDKSVTVSATVTGGNGVSAPGNQTLTLSEDETLPTVTLVLTPASIDENGGVSTVTATLSGASSEATTVTVSAAAVSPAVSGDFTLSSTTTLTIAALATASSGTVTITGVDNSVYAPDKSVRVSATVTGGNGVSAPGNQTLTLSEDETLPTVTLVLTPGSVTENGGVATVTATLSGTTSAATTLTVSATAVSPAVSGDFTLSSTTTLTIAALATASSGLVTITGVDNSIDAPDKSVRVSATVTGGNGVSAPGNQTLTLSDDEVTPTLTLVLTPGSVSENGGISTVTASLSGASSAATTVTVSATAVSPAVSGDFTLSSTTTLTIAALATASSGTVTITGVDNSVDAPDKSVTVSATVSGGNGVSAPSNQTLTLTDDEATPAVTLVLTPGSVTENGGVATVTASLSGASSASTTVTVSAAAVSPAVSGDFTLSSTTTLTIAALATTSSGTVTITGVDNSVDAPNKSVTVSGTASNTQGATDPADVTLTLTDDEATPAVTLVLTPASVTENGGVATVTATLSGASSEATTLTVSAAAVSPAVAGDFTLSSTTTLTIAALATTSSGTVTITGVDNSVDAPNKSVTVSGTASNTQGATDPADVTLTLTDDEATPAVTLVLTPASVTENGGVATVTASLSGASSEATTLTVSAAAVSPAVSGDFTLSSTTTLTIAALATTSSGTVTITGVDNSVYAPDKSVTVSATVSGGNGVSAPGNQTLTLSEDETLPTVTLVLTPGSVTENGGVATVTASLSGATSASTTLTVSATAVSPAVSGDFTLSSTTTLTIAALATASSGLVTITGVDNSIDAPDKSVRVSATVSGGNGVSAPGNQTLTLSDDEVTPTLTLVLTPASIDENGGISTVTASLSGASSAATTVTVSAAAVSPAVSGDFTLSSTTTLTIAALATASSGTVTITGVDNSVDAPDKSVTVSATVTGGNGVSAPSNQTLTLTDDEATPTLTLVLTPGSVTENGGVAAVTASLSGASSASTTVTVSAAAVSPAVSGDFTLSSTTTLTIAALATTSSGTVTITGVDNSVDAPNKSVTVSATVSGGNGVSAPGNQTLTLTDDEATPAVTLVLTPASVTENGGVATVTATLSGASSEATTVTVTAAAVSPVVAGDFTLSSTTTLTIAALATASSGTVTITGVDNSVDAPDKSVTVSGTASNAQGVTDPADVTLTLTDDESAPSVTLVLDTASVSEAGGVATVTASLSGASSASTTVTVSAAAVSPAVAGDFTLSSTTTLTIAALATTSSGTVTVTGVDNSVDAPDKSVTVSGTASNAQGVTDPADVTLTLTDDESAPSVTLVLDTASVSENGGVATVTASLSGASSASTTVTVSAAAVSPAVSGDFTLSSTTTLTIAALATTSSGTVTVTGVDNSVDAPDKSVTVSGTASNAQGVTDPADVTLTLTDDESAPSVTLVLSPASVTENGGVATVTATLSGASSASTTVTVSAAAVSPAVAGDFTLSSTTTLTIAALATTSSGTVTITGVDNAVDAPDKSVTVSGTASNAQGVTDPADVTLALTDDEAAPSVTLVLSPASVTENGGVATATASLSGASSASTTVTVSAAAVSPAVAGDFTLSSTTTLTIAALATTSSGTVTVTGVDNSVDAPDKSVTVSGTASNAQGVTDPADVTLTLTDDESAPSVTLVLSPASVTENGGVATVTATLDYASSESTTLTVSATAVSPAVSGDFTLSSTTTLTIAALATTSSGTVTVTGVDNSVDAPDKSVTVSGTASNAQGVTDPADVTLTLTDDESAPSVTLVLSPASVTENGGVATVTATLSGASSASTTVTVSAAAVSPAVAGDFTLSSTTTLTIAANTTTSSGTVTVTGVDNSVDAPDKSVTVSATASNEQGVTGPGNQTLTLTGDESAPAVTLALSPASVTENGGVATVTATLDYASSESTTVTVSATAVSPAVSGDFTLSSTTTLTIAALATASSGTVTVTGVDNSVDAPDKSVTVSGTATNTQGATGPADVTLTLADDEATPTTITLALNLSSIREVADPTEFTVTVVLGDGTVSLPTDTIVTLTLGGSADGNIDYSSAWTPSPSVTIPALSTEAETTLTIAPVYDDLIEEVERIEVRGTAQNFTIQAAIIELVDGSNKAPTANAGSDQVVDEGAEVALNGAASSDPEGEVLTWAWTQQSGPTMTLDDPASVGPAFTAPKQLVEDATLVFALTVTDARGASATATVTITVTAGPNDPPGVDAGVDLTVVAGAAVTLNGTASDPEGEDLTWAWTQQSGPPVVLDAPVAARTTFTAPEQLTENVMLMFGLTVTDARSASASATVTIVVQADFQVLDLSESDEIANVLVRFVADENDLAEADKLALTAPPPQAIAFVSDERRQIVDVTPVDANGAPIMRTQTEVEICLFVDATMHAKFATQVNDAVLPDRLRLLHFRSSGPRGPAWMEIAGLTVTERDDGLRICGLTDRFSPFVVGAHVEAGVSLSATTLAIPEGGEASYTVLLDVAPDTGGVTVQVMAQSDTDAVTLSIGDGVASDSLELTFNDSNWGEPREVVIGVPEDGNADDGEATIVHRVSGAQYDSVTVPDIEVGITDKATLARPLVAKHWLAHFGRTVAVHTVEAISDRLTRTPTAASQVTLGGQHLDLDALLPWAGEHAGNLDASAWMGRGGVMRDGMRTGGTGPGGVMRNGLRTGEMDNRMSRSMSAGEFLSGSSFHLVSDAENSGDAGVSSVWGRGAIGRFDANLEDGVSLDGEVLTGILGADFAGERALAGVAISRSEGTGGFSGVDNGAGAVGAGELEASLTSVHPYLSLSLRGGLMIWGTVGYGRGEMRLDDEGGTFETDIRMRMAAVGMRNELMSLKDIDLALKADAFAVGMSADSTPGLPSFRTNTRRLRLALEGSQRHVSASGGVLAPSLEVGLRRDTGDAETGFGLDLGIGLAYTAPALGLTVEGRGRVLLVHQSAGFEEWGASVLVRLDPGSDGRGLFVNLVPGWGDAASGNQRLWDQGTADMAANDNAARGYLDAEFGYGFTAPGGHGILVPFGGLAMADEGTQHYRVGSRFEITPGFNVSLGAERRIDATGAAEHGVMLRGQARW